MSNPGSDKWKQSALSLNGNKMATLLEDFAGQGVLVIDLGNQAGIADFRAEINGLENPGLAGLEIFA